MRQLFSKKRSTTGARATGPFVAVDFDRLSIRIVEARPVRGRCEIEKLVIAPMPDQLNLTDGAAVGAVLAKALRDASIKASTLVMAVPRAQAVLKPLSLPQSNDIGELASMVLLQLDGQLPFPNDEAVIDFAAGSVEVEPVKAPVPTQEKSKAVVDEAPPMEVLAAAVQNLVVARYSTLAVAASAKLSCLTLRPYANAACLATLLPPAAPADASPDAAENADSADAKKAAASQVRALVTVASDEVEVTILDGARVIFSRSATLPSSPTVPLEAAASQTLRALQSYQALHPDRRVASAFIAGGSGVESDLARRVADTFKIEASTLEPQRAMQLPDVVGGSEKQGPQAFTAALGLALAFGGSDASLLPFDFINPKKPTPPRETSRTTKLLLVATCVTAIASGWLLGHLSLESKRKQVARLTDELNTLSVSVKKVTALSKRVDMIDKWTKQSIDPLNHWANLSSIFPPAQDAFINALRTDNEGRLLFTTRARNQQVVDSLAPRFMEHGYLSAPGSVATRGDSPDAPGYSFVTDVKITPSPKQTIDIAKLTAPPRPADDVNQPAPPPPKDQPSNPNSGSAEARPHDPNTAEQPSSEGKGERWRRNRNKEKGNGQ